MSQVLVGHSRQISLELMSDYTNTLGFRNPIHFAGQFADKTEFGGPIASGPFALALLDDLMMSAFPASWLTAGSLDVAFVAPVRPDDVIHADATLIGLEPGDDGATLRFDVRAVTEADIVVMAGSASVRCA